MGIDYTTEEKNGYLIIRASAVTDSPEDLLEYIDNIIAESERSNTNKVLIDNRELQFERRFVGTFELATQCVDHMTRDRNMKVALLAKSERMEYARVYETIGMARGFEIKAFDRPRIAAVWLSEEPSPSPLSYP